MTHAPSRSNTTQRRPVRTPRTRHVLAAAFALLAVSAAAGPFDVLDRVRGAVDEAANTARNAVDSATPASSSTTASDIEAGQLTVQALRAGDITPEQEVAIGNQIAGNLLGAAPLVDDAAIQAYVNRVGRWVAAQTERGEAHWRFGVIRSEDVNAFAAPGGYVFVTLGLYRLLENEAELAAVLGHEIGHVVSRHHVELLQKSSMLGAVSNVVGSRVAGDRPALQGLIGNGAEIMARGLDKDAEFEADRLGMVYAARAGYDPFAMFSVLEKIEAAGAADEGGLALLYKTHPRPAARLEALALAAGAHFDALPGPTLEQRFEAPAQPRP
jgi:predicted Zn-dependent protease